MSRLALALTLFCGSTAAAQSIDLAPPVARAHAHNDYEHGRPLFDALEHGFRSVEADVWLVDGALLVAHDREDVRPERTLQTLYLDPLRRLVANEQIERCTLMIDFKSAGEPTYRALAAVLPRYDEMLTKIEGDDVREGPISIVISGDRPIDLVAAEETRYVGIDGRPGDLESDVPAHRMPWISTSWSSEFTWLGAGEMPEAQREKLRRFVDQAHARGRMVRFWATPESPAMWRELLAADVDLINTDRLAELQAFLTETSAP